MFDEGKQGTAPERLLLNRFKEIARWSNDTPFPPSRFQRSRVNNIAVYGGCFNPPHVGHLHFLKSAFANAGRDLDLVCVLVRPSNEDWLRFDKFRDDEKPLILSPAVRASLLASDHRWPSWAGIIDRSGWSHYDDLPILKEFGESLGFKMEFIRLRGADEQQLVGEPSCRSLGLREPFLMTLVNLPHNRLGVDYSRSIVHKTDNPPWQRLSTEEDGTAFLRFQAFLRDETGQGLVRIIRAVEDRKISISSTKIRDLGTSDACNSPAGRDVLSRVLLSWDILQDDPTWREWCAGEAKSGGDQGQAQKDYDKMLEAWGEELQGLL